MEGEVFVEVAYLSKLNNTILKIPFRQIDQTLQATSLEFSSNGLMALEMINNEIGVTQSIENQSQDNFPRLNALTEILKDSGLDIQKEMASETNLEVEVTDTDLSFIYSLPWERLAINDYLQITRLRNRKPAPPSRNDNLIFLASHGFEGYGHKIVDDFDKEISAALEGFWATRSGKVKPQFLTVMRYLNVETIKKVRLEDYSSLHIMLHGKDTGEIGFETAGNHWEIEWIKPETLIDILQPYTYDLIFLSCCWSGYGSFSTPSLAQKLIDSDITKSVVAFNGEIGSEDTMKNFVGVFYKIYVINKDTKLSFYQASKLLYENKNKYADKPVLYMGGYS